MANYQQILDQYIASQNFKDGVVSATKASWGGGGYSVELFEDGTWRNLWNNQIGNRYETSGILLGLPTISENITREMDEEKAVNDDSNLRDAFDYEFDDLAKELRESLSDQLAMMEM
jgi:hypothetical protein